MNSSRARSATLPLSTSKPAQGFAAQTPPKCRRQERRQLPRTSICASSTSRALPAPLPDWSVFVVHRDSFSAPVSGRYDAEPSDERFCHRELAVDDLERQRRQGARRWTIDHGRGVARIIARIVTGTFDD